MFTFVVVAVLIFDLSKEREYLLLFAAPDVLVKSSVHRFPLGAVLSQFAELLPRGGRRSTVWWAWEPIFPLYSVVCV
jgi:hypothetical protein